MSQSCAATLTHYSPELLTTGPDFDPLLLLIALAGEVRPNPGPPRYPCSLCFKNVITIGTSYLCSRFQRLPPARGGTAQKKIIHLANWSQLIHPGPASSLTKFFFGVESVMRVNADSLLIRAAATSTSGTLNDLTTDLIMANNNLCSRCSHWLHSSCSGLRNVADYRRANSWICTTCRTHHSHAHPPHRLVPPTLPPCQTRR